MNRMQKRGIALIVVIMLMTLLAITTFGITAFVVERLRLVNARQNEINAYYMAQAGIYYGIYKYRKDGTLSPPQTYDLDLYDRKFEWGTTLAGENLTITTTGYSPKAGNNQIQKRLTAIYNTTTKKITSIGYQQ